MLTVACVLAKGDKTGPDAGPERFRQVHVERLKDMVERFLDRDHRFVCLTNMPRIEGVIDIPLSHRWAGWWSKIELFRPGLFNDRVLYFDLDVTIVGKLDEIVYKWPAFWALRNYQNIGLNSSVMMWDPPAGENIYKNFVYRQRDKIRGGDQKWISAQMPEAMCFSRLWFPSYKHHVLPNGGRVNKEAKAVIFHGRPRPWEIENGTFGISG